MTESNKSRFLVSIQQMLPEHLQVRASELNDQEVMQSIQFLTPQNDPLWKEKLSALFHGLATRQQLEAAGQALIGKQAIQMLEASKKYNSKHHWKLSPLFVGITHQTFLHLLSTVNNDQFVALQHEVLSEPIQHHLTVLAHDVINRQEELNQELEILADKIKGLNTNNITTESLVNALSKLEDAHDSAERWLVIINRALTLSWNTIRTDLIEKFNNLKERLVHTKTQVIGSHRTHRAPATGVYTLFEEHIRAVYGDDTNPQDIEALHDSEPAIEALTKFSIWYMKDYWKLGLLPQIGSEEDLKLDPLKASISEQIEYRETLLKEVFANLKKLGLETVGDFKNAQILTKEMLKTYIQSQLISL